MVSAVNVANWANGHGETWSVCIVLEAGGTLQSTLYDTKAEADELFDRLTR